ncbi:MAG: hypothetical protein R2727_06680 [Bacteroidales bacterium]
MSPHFQNDLDLTFSIGEEHKNHLDVFDTGVSVKVCSCASTNKPRNTYYATHDRKLNSGYILTRLTRF